MRKKICQKAILLVAVLLGVFGMFWMGGSEVKAASYPGIMLKVPYFPQKVSGDCGISSIAMIEAYALGYDKTSFNSVYSAVYAANGNSLYINSACSNGKYVDISMDLSTFYKQLAAGKPILIRREPYQHWSVIVGYNGSSTTLETSGFIVWDTKRWEKGDAEVANYNEVTGGKTFNLSRWLKAPNWNGSAYVDQGSTSLVRARVRGTGAIGSGSGNTDGSWLKNTGVTDITETTARINASLSPGANVTEAGFYLGTSPDNMQKTVEKASVFVESVWYDLGTGKWTSALNQGTTYYYQMYVVIGGVTYKSAVDSFTTRGEIISEFPLIENGVYKIRSVISGKLIDVPGGSNENGTVLHQWEDNGSLFQQWRAVRQSDGYSFVCVYNEKVMDITSGSASEGAKLTQYDYNGSAAQRFKLVHKGNGKYSIHPVCSNLALDIYGYSVDNGAEIRQYAYHGNDNQLFTFEYVDTQAPIISNCYVTDVTDEGYTVVCDVTDSIGISRVCFPTWTDYNGQDDLDGDWYNNAKATAISGKTYSFRVNRSAHNNESGMYTTHVYAYDTSGNHTIVTIQCCIYPLQSISLSASSVELTSGQTMQLTVNYNPSNTTTNKAVTWSSSYNNVATVDGAGNVKAVAAGQAVITANVSGRYAQCTVTVTAKDDADTKLRAFVERMYTVALGRTAESGGVDFWKNQLRTYEVDGAGIARGFILSSEFVNRGYSNAEYVQILYRTFLGREADEGGFAYWINVLNAGQSREYVLSGFVNSVEFDGLCSEYGISRGFLKEDGTAINSGIWRFTERLYKKVLGRNGEKDGVEFWTLQIANGACTPETVGKSFFGADEYLQKNTSDETYIRTLYSAFMDREPDVDGMNNWVNILRSGTGRDTVLSGFAQSAEFKGIMQSFGL